ncbi:MAG: toll/interleukin-1 receptor domain-containing protein, partial [Bacilli bacterium]|nr:toll/interleukin-1 receptor domain-containing protein [Bacilli bacterium]
MDNKEYKYDAFISYRHCELDQFVAENLHRILENYDLPKSIKKKLGITTKSFKRVFRDKEELPLSSNLEDPIVDALEKSKYLIVICSPRLKDSLWCKKEIQTFKRLRGRKNIFCVLVEGEPSDSFPEEVLFDEEKVTTNDGKTKVNRIMVEPLAADVRGTTKKEVLKKIKEEKLRLIAPMFGLDYDDLKQRQKIQKQKKIIHIVTGVAIASIAFAIYSLAMFITIQTQKNTLATHQALSLSNQSIDYLNKDNRYDAVKLAYEALTRFEDVNMPYTSTAEYALSESLGVYDIGDSYKAINVLKTDGIVDHIKISLSNKYMAVYDESETITLFESKTMKVINTYPVRGAYAHEYTYGFIGDDLFAYINKDMNISIVNAKDGKEVKTINKGGEGITSIRCEATGTYITYMSYGTVNIYNVKEDKLVTSVKYKDSILKNFYYSEDSSVVFVATSLTNFDINKEDSLTIHVFSTKDGKELNKFTLTAGYLSGIFTKDDNAYMLLNNSLGTKYNMIVLSYNYKTGNVNWKKSVDDVWGKYLIKSYADGTNDLAVCHGKTTSVLSMKDGKEIQSFSAKADVINIYSYTNRNMYLVFLADGGVNYINMDTGNSIEYMGRYEFNLNKYINAVQSETGFILIPDNDNRIILYEEKTNKEAKKEDISLDFPSTDTISALEIDTVKDE